MGYPGKDSLLKLQPSIPHDRQPAVRGANGAYKLTSGSQTGQHRSSWTGISGMLHSFEPNDYYYSHFLYKVRFFPFLVFLLLGISTFVLAGCGPPTKGDYFAVGNRTAGLRQSDMSGPPESEDELPKQIPSEVDLACPAQHFADNVTGDNNGLGARNGHGAFPFIHDIYRTLYSLGLMSSELDSGPLTSHFDWNPTALLKRFAWPDFAPVRPSCHGEILPPVENAKLRTPKFRISYSKFGLPNSGW